MNTEERKAAQRVYYHKNKEKWAARELRIKEENPEEYAIKNIKNVKRWRENNIDKVKEYKAAYYKKKPEK